MIGRMTTWMFALALALTAGCGRKVPPLDTGRHDVTTAPVPNDVMTRLNEAGWKQRVPKGFGIWVSVAKQVLFVIDGDQCVAQYPCSTAAKGTGNRERSYQTPLGWHTIDEKIGDGHPWGAVFKERKPTGRAWKPGQPPGDDMVLTRILWLRGQEPGVNAGPGIDSHDRFIYIHGTPEEDKLGTPASRGCVRLSNTDVISLFDRVPSGTPVLITEW